MYAIDLSFSQYYSSVIYPSDKQADSSVIAPLLLSHVKIVKGGSLTTLGFNHE